MTEDYDGDDHVATLARLQPILANEIMHLYRKDGIPDTPEFASIRALCELIGKFAALLTEDNPTDTQ